MHKRFQYPETWYILQNEYVLSFKLVCVFSIVVTGMGVTATVANISDISTFSPNVKYFTHTNTIISIITEDDSNISIKIYALLTKAIYFVTVYIAANNEIQIPYHLRAFNCQFY